MLNKAHKYCQYLGKVSLKVSDLMKDYPPQYISENKMNSYKKAAFIHRFQKGIIKVSRVTFDMSLSSEKELNGKDTIIKTPSNFYNYIEDQNDEKRHVWYVNFADSLLFGYYDADCFAQDEIQTLEMPLLASCMLYLDKNQLHDMEVKTVRRVSKNKNGLPPFISVPSPYLFENVPYWTTINTNPVLKSGEAVSIYGRNMRFASEEAIEKGIQVYQADLKNNIIAIAAPACGSGEYSEKDLTYILQTLICSFSAAVKQSRIAKKEVTVIHSGNWGCGAFGGNRELIYLAQMYAAGICGVDELVLHSINNSILETAKQKLSLMKYDWTVNKAVKFLEAQHYLWNISDGN